MTARLAHIRSACALCTVLAGLTLARPALADDSDASKDAPRPDATSYSFEDDLVQGDNAQPDLEVLHARRRGERTSLIRVRTHFIPELLKAGEDL